MLALSAGASNMSIRLRERARANEAVEVFPKLEAEIRELVSQDTTAPPLQQGNDNWLAAAARVGTSIQEIENLIAELQILRGNLQNEAARVQRELVGYAVLIQDAKKSISTISESLSFRRNDHMPARTAIAK
jgi:chromosome segregation ATPase